MIKSRKELSCKLCNEKFIPRTGNQIYCSSDCRTKVIKEQQNKTKDKYKNANKTCLNCGKEFAIEVFYRGAQKYCNENCRNEFYKGKSKTVNSSEETLKDIVGTRVRNILEKAKNTQPNVSMGIVVSEFVLDSFTENVKENIRKRDGYRCQVCEAQNERLEVHHILKRKLGGTNEQENLITLCVKCHRAIETNDEKHALDVCYKNARKVNGQNLGEQLTNPEKINSLRFCLENVFDDIANDQELNQSELLLKISRVLAQTE